MERVIGSLVIRCANLILIPEAEINDAIPVAATSPEPLTLVQAPVRPEPARSVSIFVLIRESAIGFMEDDALSRGASIAFYVVTSMVPVLVIILSIAGAVFGTKAAQGAIADEMSRVTGSQAAEMLETIIHGASEKHAGLLASAISVVTLLVTSSGVFGEMQAALNVIWKEPPKGTVFTRLLRGRAASLGVVAALGVLLLVSLTISAALAVPDAYINAHLPFGKFLLSSVNLGISFVLDAALIAAIYKILPDTNLEWHDVFVGAVATAFLFEAGNFVIGLYLRSSAIATTYGAAGGLIALLLWIYYSAQIFLFGAEFTKAYAFHKGSQRGRSDLMTPTQDSRATGKPANSPGG